MLRLTAIALTIALPTSALADTCHDQIAAMYDGAPLDPRIRPPHRHINEVSAADGTHIRTLESVLETAIRSVSGVVGSGLYAMILDTRSWTGPSIDGPWTENPNHLPGDRMGHVNQLRLEEQKNLEETECRGVVELGGVTLVNVRFVTRTDPNPDMGNAWFGARNSVFIDPVTNRVMRWEMTDFQNSWSAGISDEQQVITYAYDVSIRLVAPE